MKAEGGRLEVAETIQYPPLFVSDRQARVGWSASAMVWSAGHARAQSTCVVFWTRIKTIPIIRHNIITYNRRR